MRLLPNHGGVNSAGASLSHIGTPFLKLTTRKSFALRVLELFAGIGGFAAAFPAAEIVNAIDIDQTARDVYLANFQHPYSIKEIASLPFDFFARFQADMWWMSPPCTPFTQRGALRDLDDPRSDALNHLIKAVAALRPPLVSLENVVGFETSQAFQTLQERWTTVGYFIQTCLLCPSSLGWPNRRPRVYCIASLTRQPAIALPTGKAKRLSQFVDHSISPESHPALWLGKETVDCYLGAMDRVSDANDSAVTACFAASYGKAIVRSGSYLETETGYRRFSPREVARLLGFSDDFRLPDTLSVQRQWHLLGNSLSLPAVRHLLNGFLAEKYADRL